MFAHDTTQGELTAFIAGWQKDELGTRDAFVHLGDLLLKKEHSLVSFQARPGITYSLRGHISAAQKKEGPLYAMVDVIDDDPDQRWLSICFYGERISDPEERGDFVPGGLLGQDALCFDYDGQDEELLGYIARRIAEAYQATQDLVI